MPSEFFDIFTGGSGGRAQSAHSAAMSEQQARDITNTFKDISNILKTQADANARLARGEIQLPQQNATIDALRNVPRAIEGIMGDYFRKQGVVPELYSGDINKVSTQIARSGALSEPQLQDAISKLTKNFNDMNDEARRANSSGGFWRQALMGGVGGAAMVGGLMSGNLIELMSGALNAGQAISAGFKEGGTRGGMTQVGATALGLALAAANAAKDMAEQYVPRALEAGYTIARVRGMGGGLTQGEAGINQLMGMGRLGDAQVLSAQQVLQGAEIFGQTGGGTQAQLTEFTGRMRDFFVVYGQAGVQLLQAARNLQQWVPDGDMSKAFEDAINKSRAVGIESPQLQMERMQSLGQVGKQLAIADYRNISGRFDETTKTSNYLMSLGLMGGSGGAAMQEIQQGFGGALQNASQFAYLRAAGLSNQAVFEIGTRRRNINVDELKQLSTFTMRGIGGMPEYMQPAILERMGITGNALEASEAFRRGANDVEIQATLEGRGKKQAPIHDAVKSTVTDPRLKGVVEAVGGTYKLESDKIAFGFSQGAADLLKTSVAIKSVGTDLMKGVGGFVTAVDNFAHWVGRLPGGIGGTISKGNVNKVSK